MRFRYLAPVMLAATTANAQQAGITNLPDSVVQRIDRSFAVAGGAQAPGCAIAINRDGKPVLTRAYGLANLEYGVPNTPETVFESGSVAKQFTAAAVVLLAQDGKLSLDDDIRKYLPEMHDFGKKITIRHMLTHTSGLRDWYLLAALKGQPAGSHVHSLRTILDLAAHQKTLNFEPGAEYLYSNTGYILSAIIVERVSGMPFTQFMNERVFKPVGMTHTQWRDDFTRVVKGRATAYNGNAQRGYALEMPFVNVIGSGGLLTNVGDWMLWNNFLDNPTAIPGGAKLVETMTTPMTLNNGKKITYALGLVVQGDSLREISHSGSTAGYRTFLVRYPNQKLSIGVMCNAGNGVNPSTPVATAVSALVGRAPAPQLAGAVQVSRDVLKRYEGIYIGRNPETIARVTFRDTALFAQGRLLVPTSPTSFRAGATRVELELKGDKVARLVQVSGQDTAVFTPTVAFKPTRKDLTPFLGTFWNDETDARLNVVQHDSTLTVRFSAIDSLVLQPTIPDTFESPEGTFAFARDRSGKVTGFSLWAGRARNIRFTRVAK